MTADINRNTKEEMQEEGMRIRRSVVVNHTNTIAVDELQIPTMEINLPFGVCNFPSEASRFDRRDSKASVDAVPTSLGGTSLPASSEFVAAEAAVSNVIGGGTSSAEESSDVGNLRTSAAEDSAEKSREAENGDMLMLLPGTSELVSYSESQSNNSGVASATDSNDPRLNKRKINVELNASSSNSAATTAITNTIITNTSNNEYNTYERDDFEREYDSLDHSTACNVSRRRTGSRPSSSRGIETNGGPRPIDQGEKKSPVLVSSSNINANNIIDASRRISLKMNDPRDLSPNVRSSSKNINSKNILDAVRGNLREHEKPENSENGEAVVGLDVIEMSGMRDLYPHHHGPKGLPPLHSSSTSSTPHLNYVPSTGSTGSGSSGCHKPCGKNGHFGRMESNIKANFGMKKLKHSIREYSPHSKLQSSPTFRSERVRRDDLKKQVNQGSYLSMFKKKGGSSTSVVQEKGLVNVGTTNANAKSGNRTNNMIKPESQNEKSQKSILSIHEELMGIGAPGGSSSSRSPVAKVESKNARAQAQLSRKSERNLVPPGPSLLSGPKRNLLVAKSNDNFFLNTGKKRVSPIPQCFFHDGKNLYRVGKPNELQDEGTSASFASNNSNNHISTKGKKKKRVMYREQRTYSEETTSSEALSHHQAKPKAVASKGQDGARGQHGVTGSHQSPR